MHLRNPLVKVINTQMYLLISSVYIEKDKKKLNFKHTKVAKILHSNCFSLRGIQRNCVNADFFHKIHINICTYVCL